MVSAINELIWIEFLLIETELLARLGHFACYIFYSALPLMLWCGQQLQPFWPTHHRTFFLAGKEQQWDENLQIEFAVSCQDGWLTQMTSCPTSTSTAFLLRRGKLIFVAEFGWFFGPGPMALRAPASGSGPSTLDANSNGGQFRLPPHNALAATNFPDNCLTRPRDANVSAAHSCCCLYLYL